MKIRLTIITLVLAAAAACGCGAAAEAKAPSDGQDAGFFSVRQVEGGAWAFNVKTATWVKLRRGARIPGGVLIQVAPAAAVSFKSAPRRGAPEVELTVKKPMIFRLSPAAMRRLTVDEFMLSTAPTPAAAAASDAAPQSPSSLFENLGEAWSRTAATLYRFTGLPDRAPPPPVPFDAAAVAVQARPLRLTFPNDGATLVTENMPMRVRIAWDLPPRQPDPYDVYLWKTDALKGEPIGRTAGDHYSVQLSGAGDYFVQVATPGGAWQSKPHKVHLLPFLRDRDREDLARSGRERDAGVSLRFPPPAFALVTDTFPQDVDFRWRAAAKSAAGRLFELVVVDAAGRVVATRTATTEAAAIPLPAPGNYTWFVRIKNRTAESPAGESGKRNLSLLRNRMTPLTADDGLVLHRLLRTPGVDRVYFEAW
jgi:hypothetical protein